MAPNGTHRISQAVTLISIALFLAVLDKRHSTVLIEEPENSLHPWIIKTFLDCCKEQTAHKQILLTTKSPIVVAASSPESLFLIERVFGETRLTPATEREPNLQQIINSDFLDLGEYWLSGGLRAVPTTSASNDAEIFRSDQK